MMSLGMCARAMWLCTIVVGPLAAQPARLAGRGRITGTLADSAGRPIVRGYVCREWKIFENGTGVTCVPTDTLGAFAHDDLLAGPHVVTFSCQTMQFFARKHRSDSVVLAAGQELRIDARVPSRECDMRPLRTETGIFEGHYRRGFEESRLRPCRDSIESWVEFTPSADSAFARWSRARRQIDRPAAGFVRWHATRRGPWRYGHLGGSEYEMIVDSILSIRDEKPTDCR